MHKQIAEESQLNHGQLAKKKGGENRTQEYLLFSHTFLLTPQVIQNIYTNRWS